MNKKDYEEFCKIKDKQGWSIEERVKKLSFLFGRKEVETKIIKWTDCKKFLCQHIPIKQMKYISGRNKTNEKVPPPNLFEECLIEYWESVSGFKLELPLQETNEEINKNKKEKYNGLKEYWSKKKNSGE